MRGILIALMIGFGIGFVAGLTLLEKVIIVMPGGNVRDAPVITAPNAVVQPGSNAVVQPPGKEPEKK